MVYHYFSSIDFGRSYSYQCISYSLISFAAFFPRTVFIPEYFQEDECILCLYCKTKADGLEMF
jgi:hypothetical protein